VKKARNAKKPIIKSRDRIFRAVYVILFCIAPALVM